MQRMNGNRELNRSIIRSEVRKAISEYFANRNSPQATRCECQCGNFQVKNQENQDRGLRIKDRSKLNFK